MEREEFLRREEVRCEAYRLLAQCYYLPDKELIEALEHSEELARWRRAVSENTWTGSDIDSLKVDYTKLFLGPYQSLAPPYGSIYLEKSRKVMGDSTMDAKQSYQEEGLDLTLKEVPDHVAVELEFIYYLVYREVEAIINNDETNIALYLKKQKIFLQNHLGKWVSEFTENILANTDKVFYQDIARITRSLVTEDLTTTFLSPVGQTAINRSLTQVSRT
ncbi:molecular chaperone [Chloroflexota bacterium]